MRLRAVSLFLFCLALGAVVRAQSVRWEGSDSGASALQLVFEDCTPDGAPDLPTVPGLTFRKYGETNSTNISNFDVHRSVIFTYLVTNRQNTPIQIPAFSVKTNRGNLRVPAYNATAPATSAAAVASARLIPERTSVWAGEVFGLAYELNAASRANPQISPNFEWNSTPLTIEDWTKPEVTEDTAGGDRRARVIYRTRASAKTPNTVKLEAATHLLNIQTGTVGFGFFTQSRMEPVSVTSDQPVITVKPWPAGAPAGFNGVVGNFELVSKVVPENAGVGDPITWTLELKGTGNWPDITGLPTRDVSTDFQVVQPKAKRTPTEGKLFDSTLTEDVVLVPTKPGTYTLGPVDFVYFDPKSGSYQKRTAKAVKVTVAAPAASRFNINVTQPTAETPAAGTPATPGTPGAPTAEQLEKLKSKVPAPPAGIPRDPLPGSAIAAAPLPLRTWLLWTLSPVLLPLLLWAWHAVRRAQRTDPLRPQREAHARLAATIKQIKAAPAAALSPQLLLAWQRDTSFLWRVAHAAPPASTLTDAAWSALWLECDRALYSASNALPSDWSARAEAALAAKRVAGFNPFRACLPRNLFPFAALVVLALGLAATAGSQLLAAVVATDAGAAYRRGDFTAAEKSWRAAAVSAPTDWIARHNLSLALAQLDRAPESAAHAAAAFVQNPAAPAVQWHLPFSLEKAGYVPAPLAAFLRPTPVQALAQQASPARWQHAVILAALVAALGVALLIRNAYTSRRGLIAGLGLTAVVMAVLAAAAGMIGWHSYGSAADARAVIVVRASTLRSIPTEADGAQKTTALPAGSVALIVSTFLDGRWTKLQFDNGQTGWVRSGEVVGLWR